MKQITIALLVILCSAAGGYAQQTATLSGRVTDPAGAVIAGAKVTVTQTATGAKRTAVTNSEGLYVVPNLSPGDYEVTIESQGFKKSVLLNLNLQVGQNAARDFTLELGDSKETCMDCDWGVTPLINTEVSTVDGAINNKSIQSLPLNGRNYLELALLIPGNLPAPNFDPTKTDSVIISSAGQFGRGGNITIDGTDNNDDAVGRPLLNVSQDAVQEFQIATNRFSAELGRSASLIINVATKSGTNKAHGSFSFFERDRRLQGLPATYDRSTGQMVIFDRQQYAATFGGPLKKNRAWLFGLFEYRNQDGAVLVGQRNVAARQIRRTFALAPLDDLLGLVRGNWKPSDKDSLSLRYALEHSEDVGATKLDRAISSASQRQKLLNKHQAFLTNWTRVLSPTVANEFRFSVNNFKNTTDPVATGPQLTFPSIQDGVSFRVPQATTFKRLQFSEALSVIYGTHTFKFGGDVQRVDSLFDLGVFQQGRIEHVQDFAQADFNGDGKVDDNDLLFAVTLRSSKPTQSLTIKDADNNHFAFFAQDDWHVSKNLTLNLGLRYELDTNVNNNDWYSNRNPIVQSFYRGERQRDTNNFAPRVGFNWAANDGKTSVHGGYGIYYDRITLEIASLERGLDGRALAIEVRAGNVGGPDRIVNLESSVKTKYNGLLVSLEKRFSNKYQFRALYTLSKAFNYASDDQIPFSNRPVNPNNLQLEYGPTPNDRRHYFAFSGAFELPTDFNSRRL